MRMKATGAAAARFALVWSAAAAVFFVQWMQDTFGDVSIGQLLFHWRYLGGAGSIAKITAVDFFVHCIGGSLVVGATIAWVERRAWRPWLQRHADMPKLRWAGRVGSALPGLVIGASFVTLAARTSAVQFLTPMGTTDYFAAHYVPPQTVRLSGDKPKNLVLLYVESLEASYHRTDVFGHDLLESLSALQPVSFSTYEQLPGTGYTIAALVSTQCGVPLQIVGFLDWQQQGERAEAFLPGAVCLSDLLAARGYRNVFMGGASLNFSGKGKFLREHHFHETYGRVEWSRLGVASQRMSGWGLHDDDLFTQAKRKLRELHEAGRPFSLTVLTVDSHWPSGFISNGCRERGAQALDGVVECSAQLAADLVRFVRESGYDVDTNIVVIGDHLSPPNTLSDQLAKVVTRTIYNAFFARATPPANRSTVVHFDLFPTILEFIGLHPEGGREGLGFSAFGPPPVPFPNARSRAELGASTLTPSRAYFSLWQSSPVSPVSPVPALRQARPDPR